MDDEVTHAMNEGSVGVYATPTLKERAVDDALMPGFQLEQSTDSPLRFFARVQRVCARAPTPTIVQVLESELYHSVEAAT
jgi:hypothetical protein